MPCLAPNHRQVGSAWELPQQACLVGTVCSFALQAGGAHSLLRQGPGHLGEPRGTWGVPWGPGRAFFPGWLLARPTWQPTDTLTDAAFGSALDTPQLSLEHAQSTAQGG